MPTNVNLTKSQLIKYLQIAVKQRERAATKFATDYGPNSATVKEIATELAEMKSAVATLEADNVTPIEQEINKRK